MTSSSGKKPSTSEPLDENQREEAIATGTSLLTSGKRHLLTSSVPLAVSDLAESCETLSKVFGETAVECAECADPSHLQLAWEMFELAKVAKETAVECVECADPSNLQLAWEMFELAKVVYSKAAETATGEGKLETISKLCDCYLGLGEVSLENENYTQAVADFTECLVMRKANLPPDSRSIAEAHYQLGVTQALHGRYEDAESCLSSAIEVLEARVANLKKIETSHNIAKEISDLEALVAEIVEKISDHRTMEKAKAGSDSATKVPEKSKTVDLTGAKVSGTATVGSA